MLSPTVRPGALERARRASPGKSQSGYALVTVLIALALITTIGVALSGIGAVEYRTAINHRSATRAILLADAGATHALALLRGPLADREYSVLLSGPDGAPGTADDGVLAGFGLAEDDALPDTGVVQLKGRYFVRLVNDDADPGGDPALDTNHRLLAICRGETEDGGVAEVRAMLHAPAYPAIVTNGDLTLPGTPDVLGPCGGVHANGTLTVSGNPTVNGDVSASGDVILSGTITRPDGSVVEPEANALPMELEEHDPLDYCGSADYVLRDGWLETAETPPERFSLGGGDVLGWSRDAAANTYSLKANKAVEGTVCVHGNVQVTGNLGKNGDPFNITILATGSVQVGGNPRIAPDDGQEGRLIIAGGDVKISGVASGMTPAYAGLVYAGAQCQVNGTPGIGGQLMCYDNPNPAGAVELLDANRVNGTPTVTYDCSGARRRTAVAAWWQVPTL